VRSKIFLITDYKGNFGSKYNDVPYRSGFDRKLLSALFLEKGYDTEYINPLNIGQPNNIKKGDFVLYTSQEDKGLFYKSYLEDCVCSLELSGVRVIPSFWLLKAHENKVFFEMVRKRTESGIINNINSFWFGTLEEFISNKADLKYPAVIKTHNGSMSRGVFLAKTAKEAEKIVRKIARTKDPILWLRDYMRALKHKGYEKESWNRKKFIVQDYIPGLLNDFKVLVYGRKYYVLHRENKKGDFRASGQGRLMFKKDLPAGLLDFSEECFNAFKSPQASFDIGYDGTGFYLFEAQFVYFGTYTIEYSDFYFTKENETWKCLCGKSVLEKEYADSIIAFIEG
jgi:hypothetical protein